MAAAQTELKGAGEGGGGSEEGDLRKSFSVTGECRRAWLSDGRHWDRSL